MFIVYISYTPSIEWQAWSVTCFPCYLDLLRSNNLALVVPVFLFLVIWRLTYAFFCLLVGQCFLGTVPLRPPHQKQKMQRNNTTKHRSPLIQER